MGAKLNNKKGIFEEITADELVLAAAPQQQWTRISRINPQELLQGPFIMREKGSGTWCFTSQILEQSGLSPAALRISARMDTTESGKQGIKAGIGVSILSRRAIEEELRQGSLVAIEIAGIKFPASCTWCIPRIGNCLLSARPFSITCEPEPRASQPCDDPEIGSIGYAMLAITGEHECCGEYSCRDKTFVLVPSASPY